MALSPSWRLGKWGGFLLLVAAILMSGCGGGVATVSGTVSFGGQPVKGGNVVFVGSNNKTIVAEISKDGQYQAVGVPSGKANIAVDTNSFNPERFQGRGYSPPPGHEAPKGLTGGMSLEERTARYVRLPQQYADPEKSGLTLEVKGGTMTHNIEIK